MTLGFGKPKLLLGGANVQIAKNIPGRFAVGYLKPIAMSRPEKIKLGFNVRGCLRHGCSRQYVSSDRIIGYAQQKCPALGIPSRFHAVRFIQNEMGFGGRKMRGKQALLPDRHVI